MRSVTSREEQNSSGSPSSITPTALPNFDFDTGKPTKVGEYGLADETYGEWVRKLEKDKFANVTAPVQANILAFFDDGAKLPQAEDEQEKKTLKETREALQQLQALTPAKN